MGSTSFDGNGNVAALLNAQTAQTSAEYEYGPFGETIRATGPLAKENPFRFSTKRTDDTTGLILYEFRVLRADIGRWVNRDPIEEDGGLHLHGFVKNDTLQNIDPLGMTGEKCACLSNVSVEPPAPALVDIKNAGVEQGHVFRVVIELVQVFAPKNTKKHRFPLIEWWEYSNQPIQNALTPYTWVNQYVSPRPRVADKKAAQPRDIFEKWDPGKKHFTDGGNLQHSRIVLEDEPSIWKTFSGDPTKYYRDLWIYVKLRNAPECVSCCKEKLNKNCYGHSQSGDGADINVYQRLWYDAASKGLNNKYNVQGYFLWTNPAVIP